MRTVVILNSDSMGHGDADLGRRILGAFLRKCGRLKELEAIVLYNRGVTLLAEGSPVLADLVTLAEQGVDLLPCGTCVEALGIELAYGDVSDMDAILTELDAAEKVITL